MLQLSRQSDSRQSGGRSSRGAGEPVTADSCRNSLIENGLWLPEVGASAHWERDRRAAAGAPLAAPPIGARDDGPAPNHNASAIAAAAPSQVCRFGTRCDEARRGRARVRSSKFRGSRARSTTEGIRPTGRAAPARRHRTGRSCGPNDQVPASTSWAVRGGTIARPPRAPVGWHGHDELQADAPRTAELRPSRMALDLDGAPLPMRAVAGRRGRDWSRDGLGRTEPSKLEP